MLNDLFRLFPLIIAPGVVAYVRRRWPSLVRDGYLDGLVVWLFIVLAAVLFSLAVDFAFGAPLTIDAVRRGVLLGLTSAAAHTLVAGKGKPVTPAPEPSVPAIAVPTVSEERTRVAQSPWPPRAELDFDKP